MKNLFKISLVLFLFVSLSILGLLSFNALAVDDMDFEFDQNVLYDSDSPTYSNDFNMRDKTRYNGDYNATYSFNDGLAGLDVTEGSDTEVLIMPEFDGHKNVLRLIDNSPVNAYEVDINFDICINGAIEFWWQYNATHGSNHVLNFYVYESDTLILRLNINYGGLGGIASYLGGSDFDYIVATSPIDIFSHIKIKFNDTLDGYDFYFNGIHKGEFLLFANLTVGFDSFNFFSREVNVGGWFDHTIDALDVSSDVGYVEGRNRFSLTEISSTIKEVDRYEWGLCAPNDRVASGASDVNGWVDYEVGGGYAEVIDDSAENGDSVYKIWGYGDDAGIYKDGFTETSKRINVTIATNITQYATNANSINISIYSDDSTKVCDLSFTRVGGLHEMNFLSNGIYNKDFGTSWGIDERIDFNIYLDYHLKLIVLRYEIISSGNCYEFEFALESGKQGLSKVDAIVYADPGDNVIYMLVDYIGIYADFVPISGGAYGFLELPLGDYWNMLTQNLLYINSEGISKMYYYSNTGSRVDYAPEDCNIMAIDTFVSHSGERFFNMYDDYNYSYVENPSLIFFVNLLFDFNSLYIYGIELNEGNDTFPLEMFYAGVDLDESYFYLNDDDILRFVLTTNYEYPEYIHANFDINDTCTDDMSISFTSQITSGGFGDLQVSYTVGTSNFINFFDVHSTINIALPSDTEIARLGIYIYDDDKYNNSVCTGYVYNLELINYAVLPSDVDTSELLGVIISLIIIFFPTMIFYKRFGKKAIPPIFLLMLIICTITSLIPVWLFFVVIFAFAGLIIFDRKKGSDN